MAGGITGRPCRIRRSSVFWNIPLTNTSKTARRLMRVPPTSRRNLCFELSGPLRKRRQPRELEVRRRAEEIDPLSREDREIDLVTAPVGTAAIVVGQTVVASELPGAKEHSCALTHLGVPREGGYRASDEQG